MSSQQQTTTNECQTCGSHVTPDFRRVLGDNDDQVHACPNCANGGELMRGAAGDPGFDTEDTYK